MKIYSSLFRKGQPVLPYRQFVNKVNQFDWSQATDTQLKQELHKSGPMSSERRYCVIKEAIFRCNNIVLFETQLSAAYAMKWGRVAELTTVEQ